MKINKKLSLFLILLFVGFFGFEKNIKAQENIIINEVQIYGEKSSNDFIELYNPNSETISISGWKLRKKTKTGTESSIRVLPNRTNISAEGYFLWANSGDGYDSSIHADISSTATLASDNSIALFNSDDSIVDSVSWGSGHTNPFIEGDSFSSNPDKNQSIERINFIDTDDNSNDFIINNNPSPGGGSSEDEEDEDEEEPEEPIDYSGQIIINEIFPYPEPGKKEFIEIKNISD